MKETSELVWRSTRDGHIGKTDGSFEADVTEYDETADIVLISFETPSKLGKDVSEKLLAYLNTL